MTCGYCGATIQDGAAVCSICGATLSVGRSRQPLAYATAITHTPKSGRGARPGAEKRRRSPSREPARRPTRDGQATVPPRVSRSMPGSTRGVQVPMYSVAGQAEPPRMVRRHEYQAITPQTHGYDHVNWLRLCIIAVACVLLLTAGVFIYLNSTEPGQRLLAANGREASMQAYHEVGREYMSAGAISRAIWALEIANIKEPDDLEVLIDLGKAYKGNNQSDQAMLAFSRAMQVSPQHPEAYRQMINMLLETDRNYEALQVVEMAQENNGDSYFDTMQIQMLPPLPSVGDALGGRYDSRLTLKLSLPEDEKEAVIYYTLDGEDPTTSGKIYTQEEELVDGEYELRAVSYKNGMYSKEQVQRYIVRYPTPSMPRTNLATGTYPTARKISFREHDKKEGVEAIYYTVDGTRATPETGKLFDPENPIQLRMGKTTLRAVAVNKYGEVSNEMVTEYKVEVKGIKASMTNVDTMDGLVLYKTTRTEFEAKYGAPTEEVDDGTTPLGHFTRLLYPFGYATFLERGEGKEPVLEGICTTSASFAAPRGTRVGSRMEDVVSAFRDEGGEERANGDRLLYSMTDGRIGLIEKLSDNAYHIGYYQLQENGQQIELSYYVENGLVTRIEWIQFDPA